GALFELFLQVSNEYACGRRFASLGPSRITAPALYRLSASAASLHVAPIADSRRCSILFKCWVSRHGGMSTLGHVWTAPSQALPGVAAALVVVGDVCRRCGRLP